VEVHSIYTNKFIYFQTLEWILKKAREKSDIPVNLDFFKTKKISLYFDIYTKLYIGFLSVEDFLSVVPSYSDKIANIFVAIEKINTKDFDIVYYIKSKNGKLRRIRITQKETSIKDKEPDGFTNAEVRFMKYLVEDKYYLNNNDVSSLKEELKTFSFKK
jgi:hypothetical protein